jgi:hypothetical protein
MRHLFTTALLGVALGAAGLAASCGTQSGTVGTAANSTSATPDPESKPTVRLYLMTTVAGALEPCGCSKDQLGGASHFAAYVASQKDAAPNALFLGAGPLFFMDPVVDPDKKAQDEWKAEAIAGTGAELGVTAWAPGANVWADGKDAFAKYVAASKATFLGANLAGADGVSGSKIVEAGGIKIGIVGVTDPGAGLGKTPEGVTVNAPADALKREAASLRQKGARVVVALAALPRGDAIRLAHDVGDLDVLVVGKPSERGDANDKQQPAVLEGKTLVVQTSNHLQTVAVVDLFVREPKDATGPITFADAGGVAKAEELVSVSQRIRDLEARINGWEKDKNVVKADLEARRRDLADLRAQKSKLEEPGAAPAGSFFRYSVVEVREKLGADESAKNITLGYYKRVNEHNKEAFKDRLPDPPEKGKPGYIGVDACSECHSSERAVWDKTDHAKAYPTLQKEFVEYNLECVGCHVTGYDKPGGSTVTHVEKLENVGCEVCHGPGSLHAKDPGKPDLIIKQPDLKSCVTECHHPPHVDGFDPKEKVQGVLGPGHGL